MALLNIEVTYFQDSTPPDVPCTEENFERRSFVMPVELDRTALILVDMWDRHYVKSYSERAQEILRTSVVPVLEAARSVGMCIVHTPGPDIWDDMSALPPRLDPRWPPAQFKRRQMQYALYRGPRRQYPGVLHHWEKMREELQMSPLVAPLPGEAITSDGRTLHGLSIDRQIVHLIYCGFATNWCIMNRPYGIRMMRRAGYNTMLIRDATTGIEFPDTLDGMWATELAIREVEQVHGFTMSSNGFVNACSEVRESGL